VPVSAKVDCKVKQIGELVAEDGEDLLTVRSLQEVIEVSK